jgi:hypothetical protein
MPQGQAQVLAGPVPIRRDRRPGGTNIIAGLRRRMSKKAVLQGEFARKMIRKKMLDMRSFPEYTV